MPLSVTQVHAIDITEKLGSTLSLLGATFVIITFLSSSKFRKPINRLVFYASWGNILTNVATLIGTSAIKMGSRSPLCQFQAFMIQWFMPADALWTFAMACNVYLSFFYHYDSAKLRALEWKYVLICYGIPLLPSVTYFLIHTERGPIYGDAVLWCWVGLDWDFMRVAAFYGPIWIVIVLTIAIYLRVGQLIWHWRRQLDLLGKQSDCGIQERRQQTTPVHGIRRTDEVTITTEAITPPGPTPDVSDFRPGGRSINRAEIHARTLSAIRRSKRFAQNCAARNARNHANKGTLKYCKCALLFFMALLCTWVPSSINRIYTLVRPDEVPFGPSYAAGLVLPLQGLWNCVVYITTSRFACKSLWRDIVQCLWKSVRSEMPTARQGPIEQQERSLRLRSRQARVDSETVSLRCAHDKCETVDTSPMSKIHF